MGRHFSSAFLFRTPHSAFLAVFSYGNFPHVTKTSPFASSHHAPLPLVPSLMQPSTFSAASLSPSNTLWRSIYHEMHSWCQDHIPLCQLVPLAVWSSDYFDTFTHILKLLPICNPAKETFCLKKVSSPPQSPTSGAENISAVTLRWTTDNSFLEHALLILISSMALLS